MSDTPRRGRGSRAGLDLDIIVAAARGISPEHLTMQAVADVLGVDRKALNHHVTDRDSLLELLAIDAFRTRLESESVDLGETWQDACRGFARSTRDTIFATGEWLPYFRFTSQRDLVVAAPAEVVAERMLAAGFDTETTSRAMHLLVTMCHGFARDAVTTAREGGHPQIENLRQTFATSEEGYPSLRRLVEARVDNFGAAQFDFDVHSFLTAMEHLLAAPAR